MHQLLGHFVSEIGPFDNHGAAVPAGGVDVRRVRTDGHDEHVGLVEQPMSQAERRCADGGREGTVGLPGVDHDLDGRDHPGPTRSRNRARPRSASMPGGTAVTDAGVSWSQTTGTAAPSSTAVAAAPTVAGRRTTRSAAHDHKPPAPASLWPSSTGPWALMPRRPKNDSRAGCSERAARTETTGTEAGGTERAQERDRDNEQHAQADGHRHTGDDHGTTGGGHGGDEGVVHRPGFVGQLLAEPVDDEQRIVDGEAEADELDQVGHIEHHQQDVGQGVDDGQRPRGGAQGHHEGQQDGQGEPQRQG